MPEDRQQRLAIGYWSTDELLVLVLETMMFYQVVFFIDTTAEVAGTKVSLVSPGKYLFDVPAGVTIQALHNAVPPADQSAQVIALQAQVVQLTADLADCEAGHPPPPDVTPPTIAISAPLGGKVSGALQIVATASDDIGVKHVEFYGNGVLLGADPASPFVYTLDTTTLADGVLILWAKAFDAAGNVAQSAPVTVTVANVVVQPPPPGSIDLHSLPLNMNRLLVFWDHHESSRYVRWIRSICLTADNFALVFQAIDLGSQAGQLLPLAYPKYAIEFSADGNFPGVVHGTYDRVGTENRATINGVLGSEPDGPYLVRMVPYDAQGARVVNPTEQPVPFWIWIDRHGTAKDHPMVVFQNGSFDWTHDSSLSTYRWILCPKTQLKARVVPQTWFNIPSKEIPANAAFPGVFPGGEPFDTAVPKEQLTRLNFVPTNDPNMRGLYWPSITNRGITVTEFIQAYFAYGVVGGTPSLPLLDGPRGECTVYGATSLHIGHAGGIYGLTPFSFFRVGRDGSKSTFAGLRHKRPPIYWEEMHARYNDPEDQTKIPGVEVIGNWDPSIPQARRFPWEGWGLVVDSRTTGQNMAAPKVDVGPPFGKLPPHSGAGPVFFCTCRFGRVLKFQFSANDLTVLPTVTEFITGLSDPWGLAIEGNVLYVAERTADRISMWSADTPQTKIGDLIANPNGAGFGAVGKVWRKWSPLPQYVLSSGEPNLPALRAQNILGPEGCAVQDGFLYWGSMAQGEVRRINLATKQVEVCCRPSMSYQIQSYWVEIKLSDGTFGPRGTIFHTTFDNQFFGRPVAHLPVAGTDKDGAAMTHMSMGPYPGIPTAWLDKAIWNYADYARGVLRGPGGKTDSGGYATAVGVGNGMLAYASSDGGLAVYTLATLGEALPDYAKAARGYQWALDHGHSLIYGNHGLPGHIDTPLPWGENQDCDYWYELSGHVKP